MPDLHWVIQDNIFKEEAYVRLIEILERFKMPFSEHRVVPFVGTLVPAKTRSCDLIDLETFADPFLAKLKGPVICIGSYSMRHSAKKYGWTPGVFDLMEAGNFQECMKRWPTHMLNSASVVTPFKDAVWPMGEDRFIRPTDDSKYFAGKMMDYEEFRDWQKNVCVLGLDYGNSLRPETLIQVAEPLQIYAEYRCWVVKGRIVTMSLYKRGDRVQYENWDGRDDGIQAYAEDRIKEWKPHEAFVIDVCETPNGMKIVEVNTLNACGFYAADLQKLVFALDEAYAT